jgi:hypothetical protein
MHLRDKNTKRLFSQSQGYVCHLLEGRKFNSVDTSRGIFKILSSYFLSDITSFQSYSDDMIFCYQK